MFVWFFACWLNTEEIRVVRNPGQGVAPLCDRRKAARVAPEKEDRTGGLRPAHRPIGGNAVQGRTWNSLPHATDAPAHRFGVRCGPGILFLRRSQATPGGDRPSRRAQAFSRAAGRARYFFLL